MKIIGCDFHPSYQQIAVLDSVTGEIVEKALSHERKEEVRAFYAGLEGPVRVGIEASGQSQWFERMLAELGHEVWIGDMARKLAVRLYWMLRLQVNYAQLIQGSHAGQPGSFCGRG